MFGFLNINKPTGPTSHDVVAAVRRHLGRGVKVGHAGTLDPFADGVLVLCLGPATRLAQRVVRGRKEYLATVTLGARSDTDDVEGRITPTGVEPPSEPAVLEALGDFVGRIDQAPPAHSAVHIDGRRAYKLARAGLRAEMPARTVTIHELKPVRYDPRELEIDVQCEAGTYIRALARDIGERLGCGGYCSRLTRTRVGAFTLADAVSLDRLDPRRDLIEPLRAMEGVQHVVADDDTAAKIANGNSVRLSRPAEVGEAAVIDGGGRLLAIGEVAEDGLTLRPRRVFIR